jgi:predicted dehydrogenase
MMNGRSSTNHRNIRVAIVGFGYWGPNLLRNFQDNPRSSVSCVFDVDAERRLLAKRRAPHVHIADRFDDVLDDDVDLVAIATPVGTHFPLACKAVAAGKHVLVEKPLCTSEDQVDILEGLAKSSGVSVFVDHTFVFTPAVRKMAEVVNAPGFGRLLYYDSVRVNLGLFKSDSSVLWDLAPHDVSILDYVLQGALPESVSCIGAKHFGTVESIAYITLRYPNDFIAHVHVNWLAPVKIRQIVVGGAEKMLLYDDVNPVEKVRVFDQGVRLEDNPGKRHEQLVEYRIGDIYVPRVKTTEALKIEVDHIIACLLDGERSISGLASGRNVVRVLEAAEQSLRNNGAPQPLTTAAGAY